MVQQKIDTDFSADDIEIDWNYRATTGSEKRKYPRLDDKLISKRFRVRRLCVEVSTFQDDFVGELSDISAGGLAAVFHESCDLSQVVNVCCTFPDREIIAKARIQRVQPTADGFKIGVQFLDLKKEDYLYLSSLFASCSM